MPRILLGLLLLALSGPVPAAAQAALVPADRAPYSQKFELERPDARYLFLPQTPLSPEAGPYAFRFGDEALNALLDGPGTLHYLTVREGGFHLQVLNLRAGQVGPESLGPQPFRVLDAGGEVAGRGTILVLARAPEAVEAATAEGTRFFEEGRAEDVLFRVRTHGNFTGRASLLNVADWALESPLEVREEDGTGGDGRLPGVATLAGRLRPLRQGAEEVRLAVETHDGREVELRFPGITVTPPAPQRARVSGGPIYLDALGRGAAEVVVTDFSAPPRAAPRVVVEAGEGLAVVAQRWDPEAGALHARLEYVSRGTREAGLRTVREVPVRAGAQVYRGHVEVVGAPVVSGVRTAQGGRAVLAAGGAPAVLRVAGENLDHLRLDCAPLGPGARCESRGAGPAEVVAEVEVPATAREGEYFLPLVAAGAREAALPAGAAGVRVQVERTSVPLALSTAGLLRLNCEEVPGCRVAGRGEALVVTREALPRLRLLLDPSRVPPEMGAQQLTVSTTRVRGSSRQVVLSHGSASSPREYRFDTPAGALPVADAGADPQHGDLFLLRVEHAAEHYPAAGRREDVVGAAFVRSIYVDGGPARRITGDASVQPLLFTFRGTPGDADFVPLLMNAGVGIGWQFLDERMEPRPFSARLHVLALNLADVQKEEGGAGQPALFLSGNLRIPGIDAGRPLVLTGGVARVLAGDPGWRLLMGASMDLGLYKVLFGG